MEHLRRIALLFPLLWGANPVWAALPSAALAIEWETQIDDEAPYRGIVLVEEGGTTSVTASDLTLRLTPRTGSDGALRVQGAIAMKTPDGVQIFSTPVLVTRAGQPAEMSQENIGGRTVRLRIVSRAR